MKWFFLAVMVLAAGCEQSQVVSVCTEQSNGVDGGSSPIIWNDGQQYEDPDLEVKQYDGGAPCLSSFECKSGLCVFSVGSNYCFSHEMDGCIVVANPAPQKANCNSPLKTLYVCGNYDTSLLGQCAIADVGLLGEEYLCCNMP